MVYLWRCLFCCSVKDCWNRKSGISLIIIDCMFRYNYGCNWFCRGIYMDGMVLLEIWFDFVKLEIMNC